MNDNIINCKSVTSYFHLRGRARGIKAGRAMIMGWNVNGARQQISPGIAREVSNLGINLLDESEIKTVSDRPKLGNLNLQYENRARAVNIVHDEGSDFL